jgi:RNA 2',3'-cyclic 3'-phosphodiesterase
MSRTFIAIKITPDDEFVGAFQILKSQLAKEKINWVDIENLHLTLKFLGNVTEEILEFVKSELKTIQPVHPFKFQIDGIHLLKDIHTPRIIYSKIEAGQELLDLANKIDNCLDKLDLFKREKKFLPHLTLGRVKFIKGKENLELVLHDLRNIYFQQVECSEFHLYESILTPSGPIYRIIETYELF